MFFVLSSVNFRMYGVVYLFYCEMSMLNYHAVNVMIFAIFVFLYLFLKYNFVFMVGSCVHSHFCNTDFGDIVGLHESIRRLNGCMPVPR